MGCARSPALGGTHRLSERHCRIPFGAASGVSPPIRDPLSGGALRASAPAIDVGALRLGRGVHEVVDDVVGGFVALGHVDLRVSGSAGSGGGYPLRHLGTTREPSPRGESMLSRSHRRPSPGHWARTSPAPRVTASAIGSRADDNIWLW